MIVRIVTLSVAVAILEPQIAGIDKPYSVKEE